MTTPLSQFREEQIKDVSKKVYDLAEHLDELILHLQHLQTQLDLPSLWQDSFVPAYLLQIFDQHDAGELLPLLENWRDRCLEAIAQRRGRPFPLSEFRTKLE